MRRDMKHVVIDRPRTGGDGGKSIPPKGSKKRLQKTPLEDLPCYESSARRRMYSWNCKELNEHLSPLRRWLYSQVGRNWDEVWGEICEGLSIHNATTAHVRDHADQYVEKNCIIKDGKILDSRGMTLNSSWRWKQFYVDAQNNLQVAPDQRRWRHKKPKKDWIEGKDENHRYYLLEGIWYEVELKPFPLHFFSHRIHDLVIASKWNDEKRRYPGSTVDDCKNKYGREVYAAVKLQLGKREIHRLKLWEFKVT